MLIRHGVGVFQVFIQMRTCSGSFCSFLVLFFSFFLPPLQKTPQKPNKLLNKAFLTVADVSVSHDGSVNKYEKKGNACLSDSLDIILIFCLEKNPLFSNSQLKKYKRKKNPSIKKKMTQNFTT